MHRYDYNTAKLTPTPFALNCMEHVDWLFVISAAIILFTFVMEGIVAKTSQTYNEIIKNEIG